MRNLISFDGRRYIFDRFSLETPELRSFCSDEGDTNLLSAIACSRFAVVRFELLVGQLAIKSKTTRDSLEMLFQF